MKQINEKGGITSELPNWVLLLIFLAVIMMAIGFIIAPKIKSGLARLIGM